MCTEKMSKHKCYFNVYSSLDDSQLILALNMRTHSRDSRGQAWHDGWMVGMATWIHYKIVGGIILFPMVHPVIKRKKNDLVLK